MTKRFIYTLLLSVFPFLAYAEDYLQINNISSEEKKLVVCGDDKVYIVDPIKSSSTHAEIIWEWNVNNTKAQTTSNYWNRFNSMDDCKPFDNNTKLLVTSSGNGYMVIDIPTKKCLSYGYAAMAHSIEILPKGRVVMALSTHANGDAIELRNSFEKNGGVIFRDSLTSAHGVLWYEEHQRLYAVGGNVFRIYSLQDWETNKPSLKKEMEINLPISGAHDLTRINENMMLISCTNGIYYYDIQKKSITRYAPLVDYTDIKSVNVNCETGQIIYTKPEESWWTFHVKSINPEWSIPFPNTKVYKVRPFK